VVVRRGERIARHCGNLVTSFDPGMADVRFGSKADMCSAKRYVRFAPESRHSAAKCPLRARGYIERRYSRSATTAWSRPGPLRYYISSPLIGASSECVLGLAGGIGTSRADTPRRGSAGGFTCVEDTRLDVVFGGSFADCLGSDRLTPQESAIEGPAV
jgi:hypothetical protein